MRDLRALSGSRGATGEADCDVVLDELVAHVRERLAACGYEREAVLEVAADIAILRPFPGSELIIQREGGK